MLTAVATVAEMAERHGTYFSIEKHGPHAELLEWDWVHLDDVDETELSFQRLAIGCLDHVISVLHKHVPLTGSLEDEVRKCWQDALLEGGAVYIEDHGEFVDVDVQEPGTE